MRWSLVAVKWEDVTSLARFSLAGDFDARRLFKLTVGLVVHETDDYMVLADDLDLSLDPHSSNNYGTLIPKGCIRQMWSISQFDDGREKMLPDPPLPVLAGNGRPRRNGKRGRSRPVAETERVASSSPTSSEQPSSPVPRTQRPHPHPLSVSRRGATVSNPSPSPSRCTGKGVTTSHTLKLGRV